MENTRLLYIFYWTIKWALQKRDKGNYSQIKRTSSPCTSRGDMYQIRTATFNLINYHPYGVHLAEQVQVVHFIIPRTICVEGMRERYDGLGSLLHETPWTLRALVVWASFFISESRNSEDTLRNIQYLIWFFGEERTGRRKNVLKYCSSSSTVVTLPDGERTPWTFAIMKS
jgi:hypothetical protein